MGIVDRRSLARTLDAVSEAFFAGSKLSRAKREEAASWIAGRQGLEGSYAGMFAPTAEDFERGIRVFTGEKMRTRAGTSHVLGEEACRALILLDSARKETREALARATSGMRERLGSSAEAGGYCCGTCSVALWRHLAVGGLDHPERRLAGAMRTLREARSEDGRWGRFPFYYTLLALSEVEGKGVVSELRYAAPVCERLLKRRLREGVIEARRRVVMERALGRC